jgi:Ca-dependent carbohydrate-binding module xylan-binding
MVVRVDGQVVGNAAVGNVGAAQAYTFALAAAPAAGAKVDVVFTNDGVTVVNGVRTEDRNLYVESIAVDGGTPIKPTESGVTLDRGTGAAAFDGVDVIPGQTALAWNGALRFTMPGTSVPTAGKKITVRARAVYPMGAGAQMSVRHNGVVITAQPVVVNASGISPEPIDFGVAQDYVVQSTQPVRDGDTIDVAVLNAGSASACTGTTCGVRELVVEGVSVNDQEPIPATAPDVVFDRGEGAAAFDGQNVGPGQQSLAENGALRFKVRPQAASLPIAARVQAVRLAFQGVVAAAAVQTGTCASGTVNLDVVLTQDISTPIDATQRLVTKAGTQDFSYQDCTDPGNFMTRTGSVHREFESNTVIPPGNSTLGDSSSAKDTLSQWRLFNVNKVLVPLKPASAGVLVNGKASRTEVQDTAYPSNNPTYNITWVLQPGSTLTDPTTSAQATMVAGQINMVSGGFRTISSNTPVDWTFDLAGRRYVLSGRMEQYWGGRFEDVRSYRGSYEVRSNGELIGELRMIDTMRNASAPASHAYVVIDGFTYPI